MEIKYLQNPKQLNNTHAEAIKTIDPFSKNHTARFLQMKTTDQTLIEQLKISKREIERRKEYLNFTDSDIKALTSLKAIVSDNIDDIVSTFYERILPFDEIDRVIGDAETLHRLKNYQRNYILTLFFSPIFFF